MQPEDNNWEQFSLRGKSFVRSRVLFHEKCRPWPPKKLFKIFVQFEIFREIKQCVVYYTASDLKLPCMMSKNFLDFFTPLPCPQNLCMFCPHIWCIFDPPSVRPVTYMKALLFRKVPKSLFCISPVNVTDPRGNNPKLTLHFHFLYQRQEFANPACRTRSGSLL